ncbi:hypothetical protein [Actinoplanes siamensis]|nr:hypothetical protein [Actinoplanes siamensis]
MLGGECPPAGDGKATMTGDEPSEAADELREYLVSELRGAGSAAIAAGADPAAVTTDLQERLRRVNQALAALAEPTAPDPAD